MRQIWITKFGPPEVLAVRQAPDPEPKPGEVRIRVEAGGVSFADIVGRVGFYPNLPPIPVVPGYEVSGRIDAAGTGADTSWIGRDVLAMTRFGGYADVICVPVQQIFTRPPGMSALEAAALPVDYFTAWQLVVVMGGLKRGETVLVHSAGGGVGIAATQIARHIGARVIGTASASKHAELRALGVDHLIDYRTEDFEVRAREITNGRGVELRRRWRSMPEIYPALVQRPPLFAMAERLDSRSSSLRRDECGDWRINGLDGHIYAVPEGFQFVVFEQGLRGWKVAKYRLAFCAV